MALSVKAAFEPLRSIAFGAISGTYASIGTTFSNPARAIRIVNATDAAMILTDDTSVSAGKWILPAGTYVLYDLTSNRSGGGTQGQPLSLPKGTQISVKQVTAPSRDAVYVEVLYGA